ncbi:MAG: hypothetical protein ACR2K2_15915 [Mycobacteriales bacterium]
MAGRPVQAATSSDSYAEWTQTIDGILGHAGFAGRFGDPAKDPDASVGADDSEWLDLLSGIYDAFGGRTWTVREVLAWGGFDTPIPLPGDLEDKAARTGRASVARALGKWLQNRAGRWAGPFTVRRVGQGRGGAEWRVERYERVDACGSAGVAGVIPAQPGEPQADITKTVFAIGLETLPPLPHSRNLPSLDNGTNGANGTKGDAAPPADPAPLATDAHAGPCAECGERFAGRYGPGGTPRCAWCSS